MLVLAERLRLQNGGVLDEPAIQAVAEATGASEESVRLLAKLREEKQRPNLVAYLRAQFRTLEPDTRRYVTSGLMAATTAFLTILEAKISQVTQVFNGSAYGIFSMLGILVLVAGLYNMAIARDTRVAAISGAILTGGLMVMRSVFAALMLVHLTVEPIMLLPVTIGGATAGVLLHRMFAKNRTKLGLRDPVQERQELLTQLHELRERLHSGEQSMTFLSVDIVGSTRMKQNADPLAVEFTFNEYHQFVERIARKHGGRVHSTAGDGVICAFDHPQQGFGAARNLQSGLIELNTLRNKIGVPLSLRCGLHSGTVVAPDASDVTTLNFARVIDIAAHLEKVAPPGGIAVSEAVAEGLIGGMDAVGSGRTEVDGVHAAIWLPKKVAKSSGSPEPPPLPHGV
ncbi:MAG: adenylate/guanylate cyclase domain-containing protein [Fimbriimonas sp.]